jgi:transposase
MRTEAATIDGGYTGQPFADGVKQRLQATVQVVKRNQLHTFAVLPKRWVVERSFGWLEKCRRLWKNASGNSIPACSSCTSPSSYSYSEDREQALTPQACYKPTVEAAGFDILSTTQITVQLLDDHNLRNASMCHELGYPVLDPLHFS